MDDGRRDLIVRVQRSVSRVVRNARSAALGRRVSGAVGVTLNDVYVAMLPYIHRAQPVRISDLARMLRLEVTTVSRHVSALEGHGLVDREPDGGDGRSMLISLSALGEEVFTTTLDSWIEVLDEILDDWDGPALLTLTDELERFSRSLATFVSDLDDGPVTVLRGQPTPRASALRSTDS